MDPEMKDILADNYHSRRNSNEMFLWVGFSNSITIGILPIIIDSGN